MKNNTFKMMVYFYGIVMFSLIVSIFFHEIGHVIAIYLTEKTIASISFNIFQGAVTYYSVSNYSVDSLKLVASGGFIFGNILSLLMCLPFISRFRNSWTVPFLMIGVASLAGAGLMLLIGVLAPIVGDVNSLISVGISKWILLFCSLICLLMSLFLFLLIAPQMGFGHDVSLKKRCVILVGAFAPYIICILVYNFIFHPEILMKYVVNTTTGLLIGMLAMFFCWHIQTKIMFFSEEKTSLIIWKHSIYTSLLALSVIFVAFWFF